MLLCYKSNISDQESYPDDGLFIFASIDLYDCNVFRLRPYNLDMLIQAGEIKVTANEASYLQLNLHINSL